MHRHLYVVKDKGYYFAGFDPTLPTENKSVYVRDKSKAMKMSYEMACCLESYGEPEGIEVSISPLK